MDYPDRCLLRQYWHRESPVDLSGRWWTEVQQIAALYRVPHQYKMVHVPFLRDKFALMVGKGKWVVLPYLVDKDLPGLRLIPPGVEDER